MEKNSLSMARKCQVEEMEDLKVQAEAISSRVPVASNDPNDPLNWSTSLKITTYLTICLFTFIANVNSSNFTVAIVPVEKQFHVDATHATLLTALNVLLFGIGNLIWVPLMRIVGKRPVYLIALSILTAANAWSTVATTWSSLLGGRMLSGVGAAAADATVPSVVADLFFLDQRGHCMMFFHLAMTTGLFLGPPINAYLIQLHSWRWSCGFIAIFAGSLLLVGCFTIRETQYARERRQYEQSEIPAKRSHLDWLGFGVGYNKNASFFRTFWDIVRMAGYPPVIWVGAVIGSFVGWTILLQVTTSQTFLKQPYRWNIGAVGLFSISAWIGAVSSFYAGGRLIDLIANRARRNEHTAKAKPEKRLVAIVIPAIIGPVGIIIYGQCIAHKTIWVGPAFGMGMHAFALTCLSNIAVTYCVDCYQQLAGEALVTVFVLRNAIATILSVYSSQWIVEQGISVVTGEMVAIQYFLLLFAIPLYFLSPSILKSTASYGPMRRFADE